MMIAALLAAVLIAQGPSVQLIDSAQVHRVQKALAAAPLIEASRGRQSDRPVFRLKVHAGWPSRPPWIEEPTVPLYVRPSYPIYHWEFLQQVTPEAFRASALYPGMRGPSLTPLFEALFKGNSALDRRRQEAAARKEVQQALVELARPNDK